VIIAHRFPYAFAYGVSVLDGVRVLGHRCGQPAVSKGRTRAPGGVVGDVESAGWRCAETRFADPRGPRQRAQVLRDLARHHPAEVTADPDRICRQTGEQLGLR
jgi:hypothetical protein